MYAIIATGGKQYKVAEGDIFEVEKLVAEQGETLALNVVFVADGSKYITENDKLAKAKVFCEVLEHVKGDKKIIFKFKKRKGYKRTRGHRQQLTRLKVVSISLTGVEKKTATKAATTKTTSTKKTAAPAVEKKTAEAQPKAAVTKTTAKAKAEDVAAKPKTTRTRKPAAEKVEAAEKPATKTTKTAAKDEAEAPAKPVRRTTKKAAEDKPAEE